jgi:Alw26I/Eco31I/Esp3I family type II restriction m6 adenine DNA methyltransferase
MKETSDIPYRNNNLFSKYYLEKYLPESPEWKEQGHIAVFKQIKKIYTRESASIKTLNEKQLENHFFNEIFSILGFVCEVTEPTDARNFPDYAFFFDRNGLDDAHKNKGTISFFTNAIAIGEVKQWKVDLDKVSKNEYNISENPSLQIWTYLEDTEQKWGILSNGRIWRLYCKERRRDNYLEIDLSRLIESNDIDTFRFFYYFLRKDAFVKSKEGQAFLDRVLNESKDYAQKIGEDLKDNVYWAMKRIAEGFVNQKSNHLDSRDPATLARVQNNTMILLYRFLFLLYAEGKVLLDLRDQRYREYYSFHHIKHYIAETQDGPAHQRFETVKSSIQGDLKVLFKLVDQGSESFGIPKTEYFIPAYNGGLFDPERHPDLEHWEIGDKYLADAIDFLSRSKLKDGHRDFVDYSTLEIRNLGSIYEGLLEYKLKVAESDLVVSDGGWVSLDAYNADRKQKKAFGDFGEDLRVSAGHLYLATDKGERKSTGSYYTPDYIVNYIVKNTIGPVVEQKWKVAQEKGESCKDATLSINVLDPAMGSGHFLVGAVDFLSLKLLEAVQKDFEAGKIADTAPYTNDWARRDVVSHCIYGVDLNELAVELAKVGLWLTTISKDKPLSFLDHRLKQGNSLVGAKISDLAWYHEGEGTPESKTGQQAIVPPVFVKKILNKISEIEQINEENLEDIKKKERIFNELQSILEYQKVMQIADLNTSFYFGNKIENPTTRLPSSYYYNLVGSMFDIDTQWGIRSNYEWFKKALEMGKEKSFFHWELEFPEIFFDAGKLRENPGWDAVIGNPPYDVISEKEQNRAVEFDKKYYLNHPVYSAAVGNKLNLYRLFISLSISLLRKTGFHGFIVPMALIGDTQAKPLRTELLKNQKIIVIEAFPQKDDPNNRIFLEAKLSTCVYILNRSSPVEFCVRVHPGKYILPESSRIFIDVNKIQTFDPVNLSIPSYPGLKQNDFDLALKIIQNSGGNKLSEYVNTQQGEVNLTTHVRFLSDTPPGSLVLRGAHVGRYEFQEKPKQGTPKFLDSKRFLDSFREGTKAYDYRELRIGYQRGAAIDNWRRIIATIIPAGNFCSDTINYIVKPKDLNLFAILGFLNSTLWEWRFRLTSTNNHVNAYEIDSMPIHRISFITPADRRTSLVNEAKELYQSFTQSTDPQPLLAFVDSRLAAQPEESDVVHDLLAFLAEQMVDRNKEKNNEIKAFLNFVESEIGASVETLSNKTLIQEYYANDFTKFVDVLVKNKSKIKEGYNPKSRAHHETLKDWYDSSVANLKPLMEKIAATDALIDQIVYKLYGLTEEEIRIVEGNGKTLR